MLSFSDARQVDRQQCAEEDLRGIMVPQCDAVGGEEDGGEGASCWESDVLNCKACNVTLPHRELTRPDAGVLHLGLTAVY